MKPVPQRRHSHRQSHPERQSQAEMDRQGHMTQPCPFPGPPQESQIPKVAGERLRAQGTPFSSKPWMLSQACPGRGGWGGQEV